MKLDRLFRVAVVGGSALVAGCGPKNAPTPEATPAATEQPAPTPAVPTPVTPEDVDCMEVCDYSSDPVCPDPNMDGAMGCCWLMLDPHPCCDFTPELDGK